jgi:hypothetical protein
MPDQWKTVKANEIKPGDRIRTPDGMELIASRIETPFLGIDSMVAFIEDTPQRWIKRPFANDSDIEVLSGN